MVYGNLNVFKKFDTNKINLGNDIFKILCDVYIYVLFVNVLDC